jgi:outer membrane lipoprotein-sorting protein
MLARFVILNAVSFSLTASLYGGENLESLGKKLGEAAAQVKSMSCKEHTIVSSDMGGGNSLSSEADGSLEFRRQGGKIQWRSEERATQVQRSGKTQSKQNFENVRFDDGDHSWMVLKSGGKVMAYTLKMRTSVEIFADKPFFDALSADNEVKVLPEAVIEGKKVAVIEALPKMFKGKLGPGQGVTQYFIQQDTGLIVKKVIHDVKAKPMTTLTRSNITLNPTLEPGRFAPPAGATVVDMNKG